MENRFSMGSRRESAVGDVTDVDSSRATFFDIQIDPYFWDDFWRWKKSQSNLKKGIKS
jgi:hypothetical protein